MTHPTPDVNMKNGGSASRSYRCALCGNAEATELDVIDSSAITAEYGRQYGIPVAEYFSSVKSIALVRCNACGLESFEPMIIGQEAFYAALQDHDWYYMESKPEYDFAARYVRAGDSVLDVGSGRGAFAAFVAANGARFRGLELNAAAAAAARAAGIDVEVESVGLHGARKAGEYDVVTSFQVLEHVSQPLKFMQELLACVRPGGLVIISVPSADGYLRKQSNAILNMPPHHVTRWHHQTLEHAGRLLRIELIAIEQESLSTDHARAFWSSFFVRSLNKAMGRRTRLIDRSFTARVVARVAREASAAVAPLLARFRGRLRGHTVTAVYRRP